MSCELADWINERMKQAVLRRETVEVARLEKDLEEHKGKCMICAGYSPLESNLFRFETVIIVPEYKDASN